MNENQNQHTYYCTNRRCRKYHAEVTAIQPADVRAFTGRSLGCEQCGQILLWLRVKQAETALSADGGPMYGAKCAWEGTK